MTLFEFILELNRQDMEERRQRIFRWFDGGAMEERFAKRVSWVERGRPCPVCDAGTPMVLHPVSHRWYCPDCTTEEEARHWTT